MQQRSFVCVFGGGGRDFSVRHFKIGVKPIYEDKCTY